MAVIGELATMVTARTQPFEKSMARARDSLGRFTSSTKKASQEVGTSLTSGLGVLGLKFIALDKAGRLAAAGIREAAKAFIEFEKSQVALQVLTGSVERTNVLMADMVEFAARTPFQLPEISRSAKNLAAFGFEADNIVDTLRRLGDVAAGIDAPLNELAAIFGKIRVQGRVFQIDINQLANRGIPAAEALAQNFGVTGEKLRDMVREGRVSFQDLQKALETMTNQGGKFSGLMERLSQTMAGQMSTAIDNLRQSSRELFEALGAPQFVTTGLQVISDAAREVGAAVRELRGLAAQTGTPRQGGVFQDPRRPTSLTNLGPSSPFAAALPSSMRGQPAAPIRGLDRILQGGRAGLVGGLMALGRQVNMLTDALEEQVKLQQRGSEITKQLRTPLEVFRDRLKELVELRRSGHLSNETFARAVRDARATALASLDGSSRPGPGLAGAAAKGSAAAMQIIARSRQKEENLNKERNSLLTAIHSALLEAREAGSAGVIETIVGGVF